MTDEMKLDCPNCGYHIGVVTLAPRLRRVASAATVDSVKLFAEAHLELHPNFESSASTVYATYVACSLSGDKPVSKKAFGAALRAMGYDVYRRADERGYRHVDLRTDHAFHRDLG